MKRNILCIANWKMNVSYRQSMKLLVKIMPVARTCAARVETVVAPSFPFLYPAARAIARWRAAVRLCAQDCFWEQSGAYTGEISPDMLADSGCTYVLIGHSERRMHLRETDKMIQKKLACVFAGKKHITPVLCIGETARQKKEGKSDKVIAAQLAIALKNVFLKKHQQFVVAYEPVWAIGSGAPMTAEEFGVRVARIRTALAAMLGAHTARRQCLILYGGSVTSSTAASYVRAGGDGVLVGGASQRADSCRELILNLAKE